MNERRIDFDSAKELYQKDRECGAVIKSPRMFGVEFEIVPNFTKIITRDGVTEIHNKTEKLVPLAWGAGHDGSVTAGGVEIQSAPMVLKKGEDTVAKFCSDVKKIGWTTDNSCGIHVHIDANDMKAKPEHVRRLFLTYFVLDYSILAMLPTARRANVFCAPLDATRAGKLLRHADTFYEKGWDMNKIVTTKATRKDFLEMFYKKPLEYIPQELRSHYHEARYHGVNFHTLYGGNGSVNYGTIEIRYLEGTLDADTILHWTAFHQHIIDNARTIREVEAIELFHTKGPKTRLKKYASLTNMPQTLVDWACGRIDMFK